MENLSSQGKISALPLGVNPKAINAPRITFLGELLDDLMI